MRHPRTYIVGFGICWLLGVVTPLSGRPVLHLILPEQSLPNTQETLTFNTLRHTLETYWNAAADTAAYRLHRLVAPMYTATTSSVDSTLRLNFRPLFPKIKRSRASNEGDRVALIVRESHLCVVIQVGQTEPIEQQWTLSTLDTTQSTVIARWIAEQLTDRYLPIGRLLSHTYPTDGSAWMDHLRIARYYELLSPAGRLDPQWIGSDQAVEWIAVGLLCERFGSVAAEDQALKLAASCYRKGISSASAWRKPLRRRIHALDTEIATAIHAAQHEAWISQLLPEHYTLPDSCRQLILVYNDTPQRVLCAFRRYERRENGRWQEVAPLVHANIGRAGIALRDTKVESDGKTPAGAFAMGMGFGYARDIALQWPYLVVDKSHRWVDDPQDPDYNRLITGNTSAHSFEYLRRDDDAYKYAAVVEYNTHPIRAGKGSAIFFHLESGWNRGSAGCITVTEPLVIEVLQWLDPQKKPYMVIGSLNP
ncbi:MAG: L,D-transpeptidase family protein [Alistipes sp.]|nr:L,D-transpeptidase family protein [Alistipes sp.]